MARQPQPRPDTRQAILATAAPILALDPGAPMERVAGAAHISRATFYRHFRSRADLLAALDLEPDPGTRQRVLTAAVELIGRDGLTALSMDEVASQAGISRASIYRLFAGKPALFEAVIVEFAPFRQVIDYLDQAGDQPPEVVLHGVYRVAAGVAASRIGLVRAIFLEVTSGSPDAMDGAGRPIRAMLDALRGYLERQMDAGRLRRMDPTLAAQVLIGPLIFHLFTRPFAARVAGFEMPLDAALDQMVTAVVRGLEASGNPTSPNPQE